MLKSKKKIQREKKRRKSKISYYKFSFKIGTTPLEFK